MDEENAKWRSPRVSVTKRDAGLAALAAWGPRACRSTRGLLVGPLGLDFLIKALALGQQYAEWQIVERDRNAVGRIEMPVIAIR